MAEKRGLGRGLSALMADVGLNKPGDDQGETRARTPDRMVPIEKIHPNTRQPRQSFPPEQLNELAESIAARGVIQPLVLRPLAGQPGEYELVAGERRWRASQIAQLHEVPAVIRDLTDSQVFELALIENIQRQDLNAFEEASAYQRLQSEYGHRQEDIASIVGKSRSHVGNMMRLLHLPDSILAYLRSGELSAGHAKAIMGSPRREEYARVIVDKALSVRQAEEMVYNNAEKIIERATRPDPEEPDVNLRELINDLSAELKMKVQVKHKSAEKGGTLTFTYTSLDEFEALMKRLGMDVDWGE